MILGSRFLTPLLDMIHSYTSPKPRMRGGTQPVGSVMPDIEATWQALLAGSDTVV